MPTDWALIDPAQSTDPFAWTAVPASIDPVTTILPRTSTYAWTGFRVVVHDQVAPGVATNLNLRVVVKPEGDMGVSTGSPKPTVELRPAISVI